MHLTSGTRLGPYEILAPLGAGGMGEVYRARDTRLGRDVAIKVLSQHLSANPEIHARFEREARTISSLNHPHICTVHDVGREGDTDYLVMELIEGDTLAQRIAKGPIPLAETVRLGIQIADALDRAHRAGIVHRDFKPGNVMLTRSGAKLMDFGLARPTGLTGPGGSGTIGHLTQSPTVASPLTAEGTIVGTFLYMAPEQLEGREADARSDIWALGCVLYEMLTGHRAFDGKSQASLIGAIMSTEPAPILARAPLTPPALEALVRACLAKDPDERIQTAHDVKLQLSWLGQSSSQSGDAAPARPARHARTPAWTWALAGAALAALVTAGLFMWRGAGGAATTRDNVVFTIPLPASVVAVDMPRMSPDGRTLAFAAQDTLNRNMVWVRPMNSLVANPIPGTEGTRSPFWSPDSRYLGFIAGGKLKKVALTGGPPVVVCDAPRGSDGAWGSRDVILFDGGDADPIWRVNASGGVAGVAIHGDSIRQIGWPAFLPDGKHFLFTRLGGGSSETMVAALDDTASRTIGMPGSRVEFSPEGYVLFARDRSLMAQRFDSGRLKVSGEPFPIAENLPTGGNASANFSVSRTGVLAYRPSGMTLNRLAWLDRSGREISTIAPAADFRAPALSPDGKRIAIRRSDGANLDVWMIDLTRGVTTRFTFDDTPDGNPIWSPDGTQIAYVGGQGLVVKAANGLGATRVVVPADPTMLPMDWSRDGRILYQASRSGPTGLDLWTVAADGSGKPEPLIQSPFNDERGRFSPDGRWLAYQSNESGRAEVYVTSLRGAAGKWQISMAGGTEPCWSRDGRELYFLSSDFQLMRVPFTADEAFHPGTPEPMFRVTVESGLRRNVYDVSPDGSRFLFLLSVGERSTPFTIVQNWKPAARK